MFIISCNNNSSSIVITPSEIIYGDNIDIIIEGLIKNTEYEVYLTSLTTKSNVAFLSKAIFYSDETGKIDIDKDESIGGNFLGKDSLGLFYISLKQNDFELANIQVEKIKGDILLFSGENDEMWNSKKMADIIESRLLKNSFQFNIYNYK